MSDPGRTAGDLLNFIETIAPARDAFDFDNIGLLVGRASAPFTKVLVALDLSLEMIEAASAGGFDVILTHHPILFRGVKSATDTTLDGELVLRLAGTGICHLAAHTNWDCAIGGINDTLFELLGGKSGQPFGSSARPGSMPIARIGEYQGESDFFDHAAKALGGPVLIYGPRPRRVTKFAVCGGAADDEWEAARALGAEVFVTGEVRHHHGVHAASRGMCLVQGGHYATEAPGMRAMTRRLQQAFGTGAASHFEGGSGVPVVTG